MSLFFLRKFQTDIFFLYYCLAPVHVQNELSLLTVKSNRARQPSVVPFLSYLYFPFQTVKHTLIIQTNQ